MNDSPSPIMNPNFLLSVENVLSVASRGARNAVKEKHPLDMTATMNQPFEFGLTRPTILKMEKQRQLLHYLRLEQMQFKDLGAWASSTLGHLVICPLMGYTGD